MRNLIFVGILFLGIGFVLFYLNDYAWDVRVVYGVLGGIGVGLILGGLTGYISKGAAIKRKEKDKEIKRLQAEKERLIKVQNKEQSKSTNQPS